MIRIRVESRVESVTVAPDGEIVLVAVTDRFCRVWHGRVVGRMAPEDMPRLLAVTGATNPDQAAGSTVVAEYAVFGPITGLVSADGNSRVEFV